MCEYFLLIPIDVLSSKLIEGQIKELQGVVTNTPPPQAENDQQKPGQYRVKWSLFALLHETEAGTPSDHITMNSEHQGEVPYKGDQGLKVKELNNF